METQGYQVKVESSGVLGEMTPPSENKSLQTESGVENDLPVDLSKDETELFTDWKAGRQEWLIMIVLLIVSLMASIDATILVPVLPVSID